MAEPVSRTAGESGSIDLRQAIDPQLVDQLQGLHLPQAIGWWPLAPGWWSLAVLLLLALLFGIYKFMHYRHQPKDDTRWLKQVNKCYDDWRTHQQSARYLHRINHLLREQAVQRSGRRVVARLTGDDWIDYLSKTTEIAPTDELQYLLSEACYQKEVSVDVDQVHPGVVQLARGLTHTATNRPANTMAGAPT